MLAALSDLNAYKIARAFTPPDMQFLGDFNGDGVITNADIQGMIAVLVPDKDRLILSPNRRLRYF